MPKLGAIFKTLFVCLLCLAAGVVSAQSTGAISGTVLDQAGNILPGAFIAVRNETTQATQRVTADGEGKFTVSNLPLGTYSVEASAPNFAPRVREGVQLTASGVSGITLSLNVGNMAQTVTVEANASMAAELAPSQAQLDTRTVKSTIAQSFVENFTAPTSDYTEVVMMAPGTFSVNPNGVGLGDGKVYFRGFSDGQYTMSFDGIPFEDTNSPTHHSWVFFPGMWIGSTDFDRSPGTASTIGPTNFGGSINMASRDPLAGMTFRATASYGSFNTKLFDLSADSGLLAGKHLFTADVHQLLSDGYQTLNRQKRDGGSMKYIYRVNDRTQVTVFTGIIDLWTNTPNTKGPTRAQVALYGDNFLLANTNDPTSPLYPLNTAFNYYHVQTDFSYVGYHSDLGGGWLVDDKLYQYRYWNKQNYQNGNTISTVSAVDKLNGYNKYGDTLTLSNTSRFGTFRTGLWYEWAYTDRYQIPGDPRTGVDALLGNFHEHFLTQSLQPYAEYEWRATSKLSVSAGVKWAYYDMDLTQYRDNGKTVGCLGGPGLIDFNTGKTATASDPLAICAAGSQAFTKHNGVYSNFLPSVDGRYRLMRNVSVYTQFAMGSVVPPSSVFDVKNAAVLTLPTPTTVKTVQGGAVMKWNRVTLDVDAYYSRFQNPYTSFTDPVTTEAVYTKPGDSNTKGFEAESNIQIGYGFGLYLNATKSKAVYDATDLYVANAPKDTETIGITYQHRNWDFGFFNKRVGSMYNDNGTINQAIPIDPFEITNLYANYTVKNSSLFRGTKFRFSVNNLQDSHAIVGIPTAGIAGTAATPYTQSPNDVLTLLAGRSISVSMTFGWAPKK
jgi:iron complex outermembrane recepter protein